MRGTALSRERACWNECEELSGDVIARTSVWNFRAEVVIWKQHRALYIYIHLVNSLSPHAVLCGHFHTPSFPPTGAKQRSCAGTLQSSSSCCGGKPQIKAYSSCLLRVDSLGGFDRSRS